MNVLIVEDDDSVARFLKQTVTEAEYTPTVIEDGAEALAAAQTGDFDLLLLDVMLPGMDGFTVCRNLRAANVTTPILLITARDAQQDKIEGLDSGADDYIVKPFQIGELMARMRALLRRSVQASAPLTILRVGELALDLSTRRATRGGGAPISLSGTEYTLLEFLMRNAGRTVTRAQILDHVWQYEFDGNDNVLDVYISYLRGKIDRGQASPLIRTVRGVGYQIDAASPVAVGV